jgi:hypothetical protein
LTASEKWLVKLRPSDEEVVVRAADLGELSDMLLEKKKKELINASQDQRTNYDRDIRKESSGRGEDKDMDLGTRRDNLSERGENNEEGQCTRKNNKIREGGGKSELHVRSKVDVQKAASKVKRAL